mgnify:FL=1|tara:strand:+ start:5711 stop:6478 length:768 start_codon:yes stop_codon:yes gene_type:complete
MTKFLFVIANYPDWRQEFFDKYMSPRNKEYSHHHGFEYIEFRGGEPFYRDHPTWWKFTKLTDMIKDGTVKEGDTFSHIDADMCIVDGRMPFITNKTFTYSVDSCNTHCMGLYSLKINEWALKMLDLLLDDQRYEELKDKKTIGSMGELSAFWDIFREQASWYSLCGIQRHSWDSFLTMPHYGWHSEINEYTVYDIPELYEHVEVLPPNWNVTEIPEEDGGNQFYINPTKKEDTIVRHFAAGRAWRPDYFERPIIL